MKRWGTLVAVALLVGLVLLPGVAYGYTPTLVGPSNGTVVPLNADGGKGWYPYLSWQGQSLGCYAYEIATSPAQRADGSFDPNNIVLSNYGIFTTYFDSQHTYPYYYLRSGTYYWHVVDMFPPDSTGFSPWSASRSFTVPAVAQSGLVMDLQPESLVFEMTQGGAAPAPKTVTFGAIGDGYYTWSSTAPAVSWLREDQIDDSHCRYTVDPAGLQPGTYTAAMPVTMVYTDEPTRHITGSPYSMPITLVIKPASTARKACTIGISAKPTAVTYPKPFVLSGFLSGGVNGNWCVTWVKKPGTSRWSYSSNRIAYGQTAAGANWWYRYTPNRRGTYYFYTKFTGDMDHLPAQSKTIPVSVR